MHARRHSLGDASILEAASRPTIWCRWARRSGRRRPPACWTSRPASFVGFFDNHSLLQWQRPTWRTVERRQPRLCRGACRPGSATGSRLGCAATKVDALGGGRRHPRQPTATPSASTSVVLAAHCRSDARDARGRRAPPSAQFSARSPTGRTSVLLHRDRALMPKRRAAWASWNYLGSARDGRHGDVA